MLALHRFKRSMFSGILDEGENEVLMEGSRLSRFMKTVEAATSSIPEKDKEGDIAVREAEEDERTAREEVGRDIEEDERETEQSAVSAGGAAPIQRLVSLLEAGTYQD